MQELLRFLASTRDAQEIERKRRIAWEQEQEARYRLRQAEMERRMVEMQQEITALKARVAFNAPAPSSSDGPHSQLEYASLVSSSQQRTPSTSPTLSHSTTPAMHSPAVGLPVAGPSEASSFGSYLVSPLLPATHFVDVNTLQRRSTARQDSEEELHTDGESPPPQYRVRRKNRHDTRCLTIQVFTSPSDAIDSHVCAARYAQSFVACDDAGIGQGAS